MIFALARHVQVCVETPESVARREERPRCRPKYELACTCEARRRPDGHCIHTLALFENHIDRKHWRDITPCGMSAKDGPVGEPIRPRVDLERELVALRRRVRELTDGASDA